MADLTNHGESIGLAALTDEPWIKLHTGAPGEEGTANAAAETTRKQVTLAAASEGKRVSSTALEWADVAATETITHISVWTEESGGEPEWVAELAASKALTEGDTLKIESGELSFALD